MSQIEIVCPGCGFVGKARDAFDELGRRTAVVKCAKCQTKFRLTHPLGNKDMEHKFQVAEDIPDDSVLL